MDKLPANFLHDVEAAGDRLVAKATQLVQNKTTNITENFMSIRCKMDGGKYYNRIQSGSFQHHSMAAALRVQFGSGWTTSILNSFGIHSTVYDEFTNSCKRKHNRDNACKISLKYKKQRLMTRYGQQIVKYSPDSSHRSNPSEPDISCRSDFAKSTWDAWRYIVLCSNNSIIGLHHYASLQVTSEEINQITIRTVDQGDNQSGEWVVQRRGCVTASTFGDIVRRKAAYAPLVARLLYSKPHRTKAMQYGHDNEPRARDLYCEYLHKFCHHQASVEKTGFHTRASE